MLARIRKAKENGEGGFTLIELLVVVIIIGILSAIAIPTFLKQREKAWDKAVKSDLRNNALKMEEYLDDSAAGLYPLAGATPGAPYAFKNSETNNATAILSSNANGFCLEVISLKTFTGTTQVFNSATGRPVIAGAAGGCTASTYA